MFWLENENVGKMRLDFTGEIDKQGEQKLIQLIVDYWNSYIMLDVFTKNPGFQYIAEDIFKILDIQTLTNSRLVNHSWTVAPNLDLHWWGTQS